MIESGQTALPIRLSVHWITKIAYAFTILFLLLLALISFSVTRQVFITVLFFLFILYEVHMLISFQTIIEINQDAITLTSPLRGVYMMNWRDVDYIETSGPYYIFVGEDKRLVISLLGVRDGKQEFLALVNNFVRETGIEIEPSTMIMLSQKNTKVS